MFTDGHIRLLLVIKINIHACLYAEKSQITELIPVTHSKSRGKYSNALSEHPSNTVSRLSFEASEVILHVPFAQFVSYQIFIDFDIILYLILIEGTDNFAITIKYRYHCILFIMNPFLLVPYFYFL